MTHHVLKSGSGTPIGSVTPARLSQHYTDTANGHTWISSGLTDQDWVEVGSGTFAGTDPTWELFGEGIRPVDNREIAVGRPNAGAETCLGEGDSYNSDIKVFSYDGSFYSDVTANILVEGDGNYIEYPNTSTNSAIYAMSTIDGGIPYPGLKINVTQAGTPGTGYSVTEYWNGSAWIEFTKMLTESNFPYQSHANRVAREVGSFQIRFNHFLSNDWAKTTVDGVEGYWTRFRIASDINSTFKIDHLKLHTSRTEINADGFVEFFGWARPIKQMFINYGSFQAALNSPDNQDCYLSDKLDVGFIENRFDSDNIDRSGFTKVMPLDLDTSTPLKLRFKWHTKGNVAGYVKFVIRWGFSKAGDGVWDATTVAPSVGINEQSQTALLYIGDNEEDIEKTTNVYLDVADILPEIDTTDAASLWVTFERTGSDAGDTHGGDVCMHDVEMYYLSWRNGGFSSNY